MYEMYPWDQPADGEAARRARLAVQVALDRRDNGGDARPDLAISPGGAAAPYPTSERGQR
jgi:hypothetical protein